MKKETNRRLLCLIACIIALCAIALFAACDNKENVKTDVTIEAGNPITLEAFFDVVPDNAMFLTDISGIDTTVPAIYQLKIGYGHNKEADVICRIEDHTGPTGEAVPVTIYSNWKMPEAADCVTYLYDLSGIAKIEYQEGIPNFSVGGEYNVPVLVTDVYGNSSVILVPFTIIDDHTAPVIFGVHDLELTGNPDGLDFFAGITVSDDYDTEPVLKVDDSKVNYTVAGTYEIIYQAVDKAGNIGTAKANLKVSMPAEAKNSTDDNGEFYVGDGDPYALARKVMSGLYRGSEVETARAIFNWVHDTLWFRLLSGTRTYESAAYRGFSRHNGDCYVYYACCKMLLDIAGIENMRVDRYPRYNGNIHYWLLVKLNGEWYHCDATEGYGDHPGIWFMCTDEQINDRYHQFNGSLYPMRAGGSKDYKPSPTPTPVETPTPTPNPNVTVTPTPDPNLTVTPTPTVNPDITTQPTVTVTVTPTPQEVEPTVDTPTPTEAPPDTPTPTEAPEDPVDNV